MSDLTFREDVAATLVQHVGGDASIVAAARVSTVGTESLEALGEDPSEARGLLRFLMKNRHGSPFEHASMTFLVEAPIFVFREFHRHRIGWCLAGDTEVTLATESKTLRRVKIAELYERWHHGVVDVKGRRRFLPATRRQQVRCYNEETQEATKAQIVDVIQSGVKDLVKLTTATGQVLRCSVDHAIFTPSGWRKAGELLVDDAVYRAGIAHPTMPNKVPPSLRRGIGVWTSMMRKDFVFPINECEGCHEFFYAEEVELDHRVPVVEDVSRALDESNLQVLCLGCHDAKTQGEQALAHRLGKRAVAIATEIVSIESGGREMTYDLSVEGPWHNFLANDLVVHNSYNEESGRYKQLEPVFYTPGAERPLQQVGKAGAYEFVPGSGYQQALVHTAIMEVALKAYSRYESMLEDGIAKEVARMVLPVSIFSSMYATCNPRSMMSFLSLRTKAEGSMFPSFPQREIEMVAEQLEEAFASLFPLTYESWDHYGRVAP